MTLIPCPRPGDVAWHREETMRLASKHGLQAECAEAFDGHIKSGSDPCEAMACALYDWDI